MTFTVLKIKAYIVRPQCHFNSKNSKTVDNGGENEYDDK